MADHIYLAEKCKREFKSVVSRYSSWRHWRSLDPQGRFFTICMKGVATRDPGKLGSDFAAAQGGDERSDPVVIGKNDDLIGG